MASEKQPKSILKKAVYPATTTKTKAERDRETALYHANLIQQRKEVELQILFSIETLIDLPLATSPYNASNPCPSDASSFKEHIRLFRPSDYDDLIIERNVNERCGYTLCSNTRLKEEGVGKYRLIYKTGRAKDFKVVEKSELEKWCSEACAKRALYVKVQLSESPAWERGAIESGIKIDLLDEPKSAEDTALAGMQDLSIVDHGLEGKEKGTANLALERGDKVFSARTGLVDVRIQEKDVTKPVEAPSFQESDLSDRLDTMHLTLEGHTPSFSMQKQLGRERQNGVGGVEDEAGTGMDWEL
jgi:hypothetical protein